MQVSQMIKVSQSGQRYSELDGWLPESDTNWKTWSQLRSIIQSCEYTPSIEINFTFYLHKCANLTFPLSQTLTALIQQ